MALRPSVPSVSPYRCVLVCYIGHQKKNESRYPLLVAMSSDADFLQLWYSKLHARNGLLQTEARRETRRWAGSNRDPRKGSRKSRNNDVMNGFTRFHQRELTEENKDLPCSAPGTWGHCQVTAAQLTFH